MKSDLIEVYVSGGTKLAQSIWGLTLDQLQAKPADGSWTIHQIVVHMLDSDLIATDRMKRIACMDKPLLIAYDENGFVQLPGVDDLPTFMACELFQKNRLMTGAILRKLPQAVWDRFGIHNERGKVTLSEMLETYIHHLDHHLVFIAKKRAMFSPSINPSAT